MTNKFHINIARAFYMVSAAIKRKNQKDYQTHMKYMTQKFNALDRLYGVKDGQSTREPTESECRSFFMKWG